MTERSEHGGDSPDDVAKRLTRLSPHRAHESNWLKSVLCSLGLHRWYYPKLDTSIPQGELAYCRWCAKSKVGGAVHS